jgi:hypothetical protein
MEQRIQQKFSEFNIYNTDLTYTLLDNIAKYTTDPLLYTTSYAKIIAFTGVAGAGKTTAQIILKRECPDAITLNFADALKEICCATFSLYPEAFYGTQAEKEKIYTKYSDDKPLSGRQILQFVGTDIVRSVYPEFWLNCMRKKLFEYRNAKLVIIGDLRFDNEADLIHDFRGVVVGIVSGNADAVSSSTHISERGISRAVSYKIVNHIGITSVDEFKQEVKKIYSFLC